MLNIYMQDAYTSAFYGIIRDTQDKHGYELPEHLEAYIVMLLAHHVDRPNFEPTLSFAEQYLQLSSRMDAKTLGDTCLFVTGVFPNYRKMQRSYYQSIGIGSYNSMSGELFDQLATHFNFLGDFIDLSLRSSKRELNNLFR